MRTELAPHEVWWEGRRYGRQEDGYYRASAKPKTLLHRDVWERAHGPIPPGMEVHHAGDAPQWSVEARHLQLLTRAQHMEVHATRRPRAKVSGIIPPGVRWATVREVAGYTGRRPAVVRRLCRLGVLRARVVGGRWVIEVEDGRPVLGYYPGLDVHASTG